ncbi:MAG: hypothetical protein WCK29_03985 [archaeon]
MNQRRFNSVMPVANHKWAAQVLKMEDNPAAGPDLLGKDKNVELKFCLVPAARNYIKWTTLEYQLKYDEIKPCYWGVGTYQLNRSVSSIRTTNPDILESYVTQREIFIVHWDWIKQFQPHDVSGKTQQSAWKHTLRYPRFNALPKIKKSYEFEKGLVHITEKVPERLFLLD